MAHERQGRSMAERTSTECDVRFKYQSSLMIRIYPSRTPTICARYHRNFCVVCAKAEESIFIDEIQRIVGDSLGINSPNLSSKPITSLGPSLFSLKRSLLLWKNLYQAQYFLRETVEIVSILGSDTDYAYTFERKRMANVYFVCFLRMAERELCTPFEMIKENKSRYGDNLPETVSTSLALVYLEPNRLSDAEDLITTISGPIQADIRAALCFRKYNSMESLEIRSKLANAAETMHGKSSLMGLQSATFRSLVALASGKQTTPFLERLPIVLRQKGILAFLLLKKRRSNLLPSKSLKREDDLQRATKLAFNASYGSRGIYAYHARNHDAICSIFSGQLSKARNIATGVSEELKEAGADPSHPLSRASRWLIAMLQGTDSLEELLTVMDLMAFLVDWAISSQWLPDLIFSGAIFHEEEESHALSYSQTREYTS
ncbi:hypothetical protein M501DRAFT_1012198 [Patellaria atrata CBS 101060]|uniref:Uncharacterized protein n=1 Tax=Patellaria atrata CBS 101060 TaxID=1346257 RepID=A0A9P4VT73_9PEZI|nr:hypothetical protein M501DRAFT_1012198 [Patellaria atrata CBS 101060]